MNIAEVRKQMKVEQTIITKALTNPDIVGGPLSGQLPIQPIAPQPVPRLIDVLPRVYVTNPAMKLRIGTAPGAKPPAQTPEGDQKDLVVLDTLTIDELPGQDRTFAFGVKASTQALADIASLPAWLATVLRGGVEAAMSQYILQELMGVATPYSGSATGIAALLEAMAESSTITQDGAFCDTVVMSQATMLKYADSDAWSDDYTKFAGVPVGLAAGLSTDFVLVGPMQSRSLMMIREDAQVLVGMEGTDFIDNMRTVLGEMRGEFSVWSEEIVSVGLV